MAEAVFKLVSDPSAFISGVNQADKAQQALGKEVDDFGKSSKKAYEDAAASQKKFTDETGKNVEIQKSLKAQLRELKAQLADATDPKEVERLAKAAGLLADQIGDASDAANVFATDSPFEAVGNAIGSVSGKLRNLDFKGAAQQSQLLVSATKQITFKEGLAGIKDLGTTFANIGKSLLMNPIFLIGAAITLIVTNFDKLKNAGGFIGDMFRGIGDAIGYVLDLGEDFLNFIGLIDSTQKSLEELTKANEQLMANIGARYDLEIAKAKRAKKEVEQLEIEKAKVILGGVQKQLEITQAAYARGEFDAEEYATKLYEIGLASNKANIDLITAETAAQTKAAEAAKKRAEDLKKLREDLTNALLDLQKKANAAELSMLKGEERLKFQQKLAQDEINLLQQTILKKGQLVDKNFKFTAEQQKEFDKIRMAVDREYYNGVFQLAVENANKQAQLEKNSNDTTISNLEFRNIIVKNGINAIQATENSTSLEREIMDEERKKTLLQQEEKYQAARLELTLKGIDAETKVKTAALNVELQSIQTKTDAESIARSAAIEKEIASITGNSDLAKEAAKTSTQVVLSGIKEEIKKADAELKSSGFKIDWEKIFGVEPGELESIKTNLGKLAQEGTKLLTAYLDVQDQTLDKELEAIQKKQEARDKEISDIENKLNDENNLRNEGLANNAARLEEDLKAKKKAQKEALLQEQNLKEEQEKIAKERILFQQAQQASSLVTAIADIFASTASGGPIGVALGAVTVAAMLAAFAYAQGQASAALNKADSSFKDGVVGLEGPGTETSDSIPANLSKNESVITAKGTRKAQTLLEGLNANDNKMIELGIAELLKNTGISIESIPQDLKNTRNSIREKEYSLQFSNNNRTMEGQLGELNDKFDSINKKMNTTMLELSDGRIMIKTGDSITYIKPFSGR